MSQKKITIEELDRDRYSRTAILKIGEKELKFPNFFPQIKNNEELDAFIEMITLSPPEHIGAYTVRLSDHPNEVFSNKSLLNQLTIDLASYAYQPIRNFYDKIIMMIDPSAEYLFYEGGTNSTKLSNQIKHIYKRERKLKTISNFLQNKENMRNKLSHEKFGSWKKREYKKFWYTLDKNQEKMSELIGETHDIEINYNTDILLPFVPIILNEGMLDISIRINKISNAIAARESATYLILNITTLKNDVIMDKIIDFLKNDPNKITVLKIKYMALYKSGYMVQRENYRKLMKTMSNIIKNENEKFFILLDGDIQSFPSAAVGFDMVSTSMTGLDGDGAFGSYPGSPYGRWFYSKKLWSISRNKTVEMFENNKSPPCSCPACVELKQIGPRKVKPKKWNKLRREHYLHKMNDLMKTIVNHISHNEIELIQQIILQSEVPKLAELIPRM